MFTFFGAPRRAGVDRGNRRAIEVGLRIFSSYHVGAGKIWIITEADRSSACILLTGEY